ncbi:unnamed protein product [Closterium sp. Naga37s-1]|nr:unnamed protein product [Closterium sp. Naga37s-1]
MTSPATVLHNEPSPIVSVGNQVADKEIRLRRARRRAPLDLLHDLDKVEERITVRVEDIVSSSQLDSRQHQQDYAKDIAASLARSLYPVASVHPALISAVHSAAAALLAVSGSALAQESSRVLSASSRQFENSNSSNPSTAAAKSLNSSLPHSPSPHSLSPHSSPHSVRPFSTSTAAPPSSPFARPPHQPLPQHKDLLQLPPPPPVPQRRVVVTGIGMVTPLGVGSAATWQRLIGGNSAIRALTPSDIAIPGMTDSLAAALLSQLPSRIAGVVPPVPPAPPAPPVAADSRPDIPSAAHAGVEGDKSGLEGMPRFVQHAIRAADEAMMDARWMPEEEEDRVRTGVCVGGGIGSISEVAAAGHLLFEQKPRRISPHFVPRILINMAAGHISIRHRLKGPNHASVTACASSAHAIADAFRLVRCGAADVIVAGGTEACVDALSLAGFSRMRALSTRFNDTPHLASRPFDKSRDGFVMAEGAGVLVLEDLDHAVQRGAKVYAEVRGAGSSADAFHITQPSPLATGAVLCMRAALKEAGLQPSDIGYLNAHATSTPLGDEIEALALKAVFDQHVLSGDLSFSSSKGAMGHLLGAAGAVEAAVAVMALHHQPALSPIPPSVHPSFRLPLPSFPLRSPLIPPAITSHSPSDHPHPPCPLRISPPLTLHSTCPYPSFPQRSHRTPNNPPTLTPLSPHAHPSFPSRSPLFPLTLTPLSPHAHPSFPSPSPLFPLTLTPLSPHAHPSFPSRSPLFPLMLTPLSPHAHPSFPSSSPLFPPTLTPLSPHAHPLFPPTLTPSFPPRSPLFPRGSHP